MRLSVVVPAMATAGAAAAGTLVSQAGVAGAYPAQPPTDPSYYYMGSTSTSLAYNLGCGQAGQDNSTGRNSQTVLDFGGQLADGSGTLAIFNNFTFTNNDIKNVAVAYAQGYASCFGGGNTENYVALTTNNSFQGISASGGEGWGDVVTLSQQDVVGDGFGGHVVVTGGTDMEPGFGAEGPSLDWVGGYDSTASEYLLYTGSADGCPESPGANTACANGWTQGAVYKASVGYSGGRAFGLALPQIYFQSQALQWGQLAAYSVQNPLSGTGPLEPIGPTEEYPRASGTYKAGQAWQALGAALDQVQVGAGTASQNMAYISEVQESLG